MPIDKEILLCSQPELKIQSEYAMQEKAKGFYEREVYSRITPVMKDFISKQTMMFISTSDKSGACDSSLRAAEKDFVLVLDEHRLVYPEFNGNGVMASLANITQNPHIALLFIDFFETQVGLHVNGDAKIVNANNFEDVFSESECIKINNFAQTLARAQVTWVLVEVEEAYIHCSKNIPKLAIAT